ncbi:pilus assembly protein [Bradyrhizobium septentrionale]|uniref:Pilus assembly protein n=1 Tax=Bradyrhizobium septentrionale TaxID=1404411 RepID=A0A973VY81_9BRAD|nr:TadE/TadG family type IV pilus assembly protein [Bradyrhizobium septentrionale]UGY12654.1 pilus assembly protein [Bradyrhizobium septentrionale]
MKLTTRSCLKRFVTDRRANVAIMFALATVPLIYLLGMAMDYTQALRKKNQLDAAADAAAIAAVRPAMLLQTDSAAQAAAAAVFASTANSMSGLTQVPSPTITITDSGLQRTVTVSYNTQSINNFRMVLGKAAWPINGSSTARAASAPNMNFYLVLDDSPSMAIGATQDDINHLISYTSSQPSASKSCGFACHETHPNLDTGANASTVDNLTIARNKGVTLRIDLVVNAVNQLLVSWSNCPQSGVSGGVMQCMSALNNTTYKAGLYTFDYNFNTLQSPTSPSVAGGAISKIQLMTVDHQNCVISGSCTTDYGTDIENALTSVNGIMPNPGLGSNQSGDTPQEVVFLVTDGVDDKIIALSSSCNVNATLQAVGSNYRCQQPLNPAICTTIKNRGIRIAILYTEYLQLPTDSWYMGHIAQFNSPSSSSGQIAQNLQACASPGLFSDVQTGGDISAALTDLFIKVASSTASLTQ